MDYRDEREALRGRVDHLEHALDERKSHDLRVDRSEAALREIAEMRGRLDALARELGAGAPSPPAPAPPRPGLKLLVALIGAGACGVAALIALRSSSLAPPPGEHRDVSEPVLPAPNAPSRPEKPAREAPDPFWTSSLCVFDAPAGVRIAGMTREGSDPFRATMFDGATGRRLWSSARRVETGGRDGALTCAPGVIVVHGVEKDAHVYAFDAASGDEIWTIETEDTPKEVRLGKGCAALPLIDGTAAEVSLATGKPAPCKDAASMERRELPREGDAVLEEGGRLTLSRKAAGTPTWHLESATPAWEAKLGLAALGTFTAFPLLAEDARAFVLGQEPHGEQVGFVAVSRADGKVLYTAAVGKTNNSWVPFFSVKHGLVYLSLGGSLRAYDVATGKERWRAHD